MEPLLAYLAEHADTHLQELMELLRIPSISSQAEHEADTARAARWLADKLAALDLTVDVIPTEGHPLVYAESEQSPDRRTLLFYGHYDVQPVDPLDQWRSPPFAPTVRDGAIYARGASDDKGQLFTHLKAIEAYRALGRDLPVNVKFIIEGEEECGGPSVYEYTEGHADRLACDAVIISDTSLYDADTPAICYSLKGLAYLQVDVRGPAQDLHSGSFGGTVKNPGNALAEIIASLQDADGRVLIPGFYDDVRALEPDEREEFARLGYDEDDLKRDTGAPAAWGEAGFTTLERMWARPTCDVNGLWGGYAGEGAKTIIPAAAGAKISMRLVPDQDPDRIAAAFREHVRNVAPPGVQVTVTAMHGARPVMVPRDAPLVQAGMRALEHGFGARPVFIREGGSIPIVGTFQEHLQVPVLLLGYGLPDDNIHSPNEKFPVQNFHAGIRTTVWLLREAAEA